MIRIEIETNIDFIAKKKLIITELTDEWTVTKAIEFLDETKEALKKLYPGVEKG